jgi:hypothetical protein
MDFMFPINFKVVITTMIITTKWVTWTTWWTTIWCLNPNVNFMMF